MKVAHVIHSISQEVGGPSVSVPSLCEGLGALGQDVRLHVLRRGPPPDESLMPHVTLRRHDALPGGSRLGISLSMHRALRKEATECAVVHSHGLWLATNLDAYAATRGAPCRVVISPRGMLEAKALEKRRGAKMITWKLWQERAVAAADCLHVTSENELASVRALGVNRPVAVIPNGVAIPESPRPGASRQYRTLLFLGRLDPIKGIDYLIEAWSALHATFPGWQVRIVGPSSNGYGDRLRELVGQQRLPRLEIVGPAYGAQRDEELAHAEVLVLPTRSENFGMVVAEALAAGVPVVCSQGAPWAGIETHECGHWIPRGSEALVAYLREVLSAPPEELRSMGARGRAWMTADFGWQAQAKKLEDVYDWLLCGGRPPATVFVD